MRFALSLACLISTVALSGCREMIARFVPQALIRATASFCPATILPVGDSLQFRANFMIKNAPGGMQGPYDNVLLYDSDERPRAFQWRVSYPTPGTPAYPHDASGRAEITRTGLLIAHDTGVVFVNARGAGKDAEPIKVQIVAPVSRFLLLPRDTSVRVGDTVFLRADAELAGAFRPYFTFLWMDVPAPSPKLVERVEQDPDIKTTRDVREYPVVAVRPGTARVAACFASARRDTATIRISGEPLVANRDVPPKLRFTPVDTGVYVGEEFHAHIRILNANLGNGPYRWQTSTGDGSVYSDTSKIMGVTSAFGFEGDAFVYHRYFAAGRYPVEITVTDSAGRHTTVRTTYTAAVRAFDMVALLPDSQRPVRLSVDEEPDIAIAVIANPAKGLYPQHIAGAFVLTRMSGVPPLLFGHTAFDPEPDGRRRVRRDVNGDGYPDEVFLLDKATLRRNGDLRLGRNRLVMSGVIAERINRPGRESAAGFWPPVRGVVEFDVVR
jgi:hypothetical protein